MLTHCLIRRTPLSLSHHNGFAVMQERCSAILMSMTFTLLGLEAAWYLCEMENSLTYLALLVKCRSYRVPPTIILSLNGEIFRP